MRLCKRRIDCTIRVIDDTLGHLRDNRPVVRLTQIVIPVCLVTPGGRVPHHRVNQQGRHVAAVAQLSAAAAAGNVGGYVLRRIAVGIHVGFLGHLYFDGIPIAVIQSHCPGQYGKKEGSERCRACLCCRIPLGRNRRHIPYLPVCVPQLTQIRHARPDRLGCDFWENYEAVRVVRLQIGNACCAVRLPNDRNDRVVVPKDDLSQFGGAGLRRSGHAEQH